MCIIFFKKLSGTLGEPQDGMQTVTDESDFTLSVGQNLIEGGGRKKELT